MAVKIVSDDKQLARALGASSAITLALPTKTTKAEEQLVDSAQREIDDEFSDFYFDPAAGGTEDKPLALRPPFDLRNLVKLCQTNNSLEQLVSAMEVNIDGTGFEIEYDDNREHPDDDPLIAAAWEFFSEVWPGVSFISLRRRLRRDMESTGVAFMEIVRNLKGEIVFLRHMPSWSVRLVKLGRPTSVVCTITRGGKELQVRMDMRERRYAQAIGKHLVYFKEYGSARMLDKYTGMWAEDNESVPPEKQATEVMCFGVLPDAMSPYHLPRWINQIPSILGSRKAEELNLDFFNAGGLPPAMIMVQGGTLGDEVRKHLKQYMSGRGSSKHRAAIIEVPPSSGSLDSPGSVRITVERFGSERQSDSMFEKYDEKCEMRVRSSFRLPPLFVGKSHDYNYATAFASYTVAEAQVFQPERQEFDEKINTTLMREMFPGLIMRSLPVQVRDATVMMEGLGIVKEELSSESLVHAVNEITNMALALPEPGESVRERNQALASEAMRVAAAARGGAVIEKAQKADTVQLIALADEWASVLAGEAEFNETLAEQVRSMKGRDKAVFDAMITARLMSGLENDPEGAVELMSAASDICCGRKD